MKYFTYIASVIKKTKQMKKEVSVVYDNIALVLVGNFNKGQNGSYMYPDIDNSFDLLEVLCGGQDIIDILENHIIDDLEREAVEVIDEKELSE